MFTKICAAVTIAGCLILAGVGVSFALRGDAPISTPDPAKVTETDATIENGSCCEEAPSCCSKVKKSSCCGD